MSDHQQFRQTSRGIRSNQGFNRGGFGMATLIAAAVTGPVLAYDCTPVNYSCEAANSPVVAAAGQATVMLTIPGISSCTGTLLNNARGDGRPYILTARHCLGSSGSAEAAAPVIEIYYGYETDCATGIKTSKGVTYGAFSRAEFQDAWLLEAQSPVPLGINARLAGLSVAQRLDAASFGIHQVGAKAYIETEVLDLSRFVVSFGPVQALVDTLMVGLQRGTAPVGSSGSALFDAAGRVVGTLTSGASCARLGTPMRYQDIAALWSGGGTPETSLKHWLDPDDLGVAEMQGASADELAKGAQPPQWNSAEPVAPIQTNSGGATGFGLLGILLLSVLFRRRKS